jgi:hypothetical protein
VRSFYVPRYPAGADPADEQLFWQLIETRPNSEEEHRLRNRIYESYDWVALFAARGWARNSADRDDFEQAARTAILVAIVNHVPSTPFLAHAFANCRGAMRALYWARSYPDLDNRTRRIVIAVTKYIRAAGSAPSTVRASAVAEVLGLKVADVARALEILGRDTSGSGTVPLDAPIMTGSGSVQRQIEDPSAQSAFEDSEFADAVRSALTGMSERDIVCELVMLHLVEGIDIGEAAMQLRLETDRATELLAIAIPMLQATFQSRMRGEPR